MKAAIVALVVAISVSTWSYSKLQQRTGYGNGQAAFKGVILIFVMAFVVTFTIGLITLG
jgi:hypothetical protein